jgi:hypothetical protein
VSNYPVMTANFETAPFAIIVRSALVLVATQGKHKLGSPTLFAR